MVVVTTVAEGAAVNSVVVVEGAAAVSSVVVSQGAAESSGEEEEFDEITEYRPRPFNPYFEKNPPVPAARPEKTAHAQSSDVSTRLYPDLKQNSVTGGVQVLPVPRKALPRQNSGGRPQAAPPAVPIPPRRPPKPGHPTDGNSYIDVIDDKPSKWTEL